MKKFEVGKKYRGHQRNNVYECTKKNEKSVWFNGCRFELKTDAEGNEYTTSVYRITDIDARRPVECEKSDAEDKAQRLYVVCVNPYWIRNTQVFNVNGLGSDAEQDDQDISDTECEALWYDVKAPLFIGAVMANNAVEACRMAYESNTEHPHRCLYAFPVQGKGA